MPIDIAFGTVKLDNEDVAIPGKVALVWNRRYSSALLENPATPLGLGWTCRYYATLTQNVDGFVFVTPEGAAETFEDPDEVVAKGGVIRNLAAFLEIFRQGQRYIVQSWNIESGEVWRYCFHIGPLGFPWKLSSIEDVTGQGVDLLWDCNGRLSSVRQRLEQRELRLGYNKAGLIESVVLHAPNGESHIVATYEYDSQGRQIAACDTTGFADRFEYNAKGQLTREILKDGSIFHYRYDDKGRCVKRTGLNRYSEKLLHYLDAIRMTEVTDSYDRTFRYQYLPSGQTVLEIDPMGTQRTTEYDENGRIVTKTDATGATTRYAYDEQGNRACVIDALGNQTTFTYNAHHQPLLMTDAAGQIWRRAYDESNRLVETIDPLGNRWLLDYDAEGNICEVTNPKGGRKHIQSTQGVVNGVTDWLGNMTRFHLDVFGRMTERLGPLGEVSRFNYDTDGNLIEVILPDGSTLHATYDNVGNLTRFIDSNGQTTYFRYGSCRRLLERIDPVGGVMKYVWGTEPEMLEQVINEKGETYRFFFDDAGHIIREQSFDGAERQFKYDAEGYAITYTNANGETIDIQRNALHQVIRQTLPDGEQLTYSFDPMGNLLTAVNADIAITFERDPLGHITREVQGEHWIESSYDALGNLIRTITSLGHIVNYEVDANGFVSKLNTLGNQTLQFMRNAYGKETKRQMPGGVIMEQHYDDLGRLIGQRVGHGHLSNGEACVNPLQREIIRRNYTYDRNGSLTSIADGYWGRVDYVYDPAKRLLQTIRELGPTETFSYDPAGNITCIHTEDKQLTNETLIYGHGNRLLQQGSTCYEYDAEGRRIKKIEEADSDSPNVWLYEWNALDRLKAVTNPDGKIWRYKYDALARRVEKAGPGKQRQFLWDKDVVIHELDGMKLSSTWMFDAFSFAPLATVQNDCIYSIINDELGTPRELVDSKGAIALSIALKSWGEEYRKNGYESGNIDCPIRFQGQWSDDEMGLYYNRFRYFDPITASYLSQDPNRINGGINLYAYGINPCNFIDPTGLCAASDLPRLKGKSEDEVRAILTDAGFTQTHVSNSPARNERWNHPDGSEVRIHPYGNQNQTPYRSANNAHVHKESSSGQQLNDRGIPSTVPAETHIGIPNPPDLPTVRGRPHGAGTS